MSAVLRYSNLKKKLKKVVFVLSKLKFDEYNYKCMYQMFYLDTLKSTN